MGTQKEFSRGWWVERFEWAGLRLKRDASGACLEASQDGARKMGRDSSLGMTGCTATGGKGARFRERPLQRREKDKGKNKDKDKDKDKREVGG